jgi:hypothetical protein
LGRGTKRPSATPTLNSRRSLLLLRPNGQRLNGKQGTELADLIVNKITEAVNAISFK